jgi:hypothetical protein
MEKITPYLYFMSLFFIGSGVLYLWGYWYEFDINILEYMSLPDIIKATARPIVYSSFIFLIGAIVGIFLFRGNDHQPNLQPQEKSLKKVLSDYWTMIFATIAITAQAFLLKSLTPLLYLVAIFTPFLTGKYIKNIVIPIFTTLKSQAIFIFFVATVPVYSYIAGHDAAQKVIKGTSFTYVIPKTHGSDQSNTEPPKKMLRFLGQAGDYMFFLNPISHSISIEKFNAGETLELNQYPSSN